MYKAWPTVQLYRLHSCKCSCIEHLLCVGYQSAQFVHFILLNVTPVLQSRYYQFHFMHEGSEAHRGSVICPGS